MIGCLILKPTESCNLQCSYCLRTKVTSSLMNEDVLEQLYMRLSEYPFHYIKMIWHGGEPMLAGMGYYKKAMKFQNKYLRGRCISNSIQTNGTLIDKQWCKFFKKYNFSLGVSLDGDDYLNKDRKFPDGNEAFPKIIHGIKMLNINNIKYGLLAVVNTKIFGHEESFYKFMKSQTNSLRLNIVVPFGSGKNNVECFSSEDLEKISISFLRLYDLWKKDCSGNSLFRVFPFAEMAQSLVNNKVGTCAFSKNGCSGIVSIDYKGDVFSCGRFSGDESFLMGNINNNTFQEIEISNVSQMKMQRSSIIASECNGCAYLQLCNGGCAQEAYAFYSDYLKKSPYCPVYRKLFEQIEKDIHMLT